MAEQSGWSVLFALFQLAVFIAYIVTLIVVSIKYNQQLKKCPTNSAVLGNKTIVAYDDGCVTQTQDKYTGAWIALAILGFLIFITLIVACVANKDGSSCILAFLWALFRL